MALESASRLPVGALAGHDLRGAEPILQRTSTGAVEPAVPGVALDVLTRSGHPLDAATQTQLARGFGQNFAGIRVHDGTEAAAAASAVGALAYTVGSSMVFGRGQYQPATPAGKWLIAHEAAHVVQQRTGRVAAVSAPTVGAADSPLERDADRAADAVAADRGRPAPAGVAPGARSMGATGMGSVAVQRRPDTEAQDQVPGEDPSSVAEIIDSREPDDLPLPAFRGAPVLQRNSGGASCPPYNGYSAAVSLKSYNCSGLAHRSYDLKSLAATKALLSKGTPVACGASCAVGSVKHWLWQYDLGGEVGGQRIPGTPDFHTVAGLVPTGGKDPTDVFSKNGSRPVYGPGTGPSFRPPVRERNTTNDPSETPTSYGGSPVYKVRSNYVEGCTCMPCPSLDAPIQGPPKP